MDHGTEPDSTVDDVAVRLETFLSSQENPEDREAPPAGDTPTPEPVEAEAASPEQAPAEGESAETPEEQPDATDETPETVAFDPTAKVKVKVDGEELEVTLEEALKGYSRTAKWTRTMQAAAAERKAFESEQNAVRAERQQYAQYLNQLAKAVETGAEPEPDWKALQQSMKPEEFAAEYARWGIRQKDLADLKAEAERAEALVRKDQEKARNEHLAVEAERMLEAIPEWKDEKVASADKAKLVAYGSKMGWTDEDLGRVVDHRNLVLLRKAMLYDELQAKKPDIKSRIEAVRTATPGPADKATRPVSKATQARQRLAKTGKVADAAAALEDILFD